MSRRRHFTACEKGPAVSHIAEDGDDGEPRTLCGRSDVVGGWVGASAPKVRAPGVTTNPKQDDRQGANDE